MSWQILYYWSPIVWLESRQTLVSPHARSPVSALLFVYSHPLCMALSWAFHWPPGGWGETLSARGKVTFLQLASEGWGWGSQSTFHSPRISQRTGAVQGRGTGRVPLVKGREGRGEKKVWNLTSSDLEEFLSCGFVYLWGWEETFSNSKRPFIWPMQHALCYSWKTLLFFPLKQYWLHSWCCNGIEVMQQH